MKKRLLLILLTTAIVVTARSENITFSDDAVKAICVANWDTDGDGELSEAESAAVTNLGTVFEKSSIESFFELRFFTGLTSIENNAFVNCSDLTSIDIPNSVTSIGDNAFSGCTSLQIIGIPNSVTSIGNKAFYNCTGLTSIDIPNSVTSIGANAFDGCI